MAPVFLLLAEPTQSLLLAGLALAFGGLLLRAAAAGSILKDQVLSTAGVYSFLRHPLYVGSFFVGGGFVLSSGRWWLIPLYILGFMALYLEVVRREEAKLITTFGTAYVRYRDTVPSVLPWLGRRVAGPRTYVFRLSTYRRNHEWQAAVGVGVGFGLLWLKMTFLP